MIYFIFSFFYIVTTVAYLLFRITIYRAYASVDTLPVDTIDMYAMFLKVDLPFFLIRLSILIIGAIAIALYRRTAADIAYSLLMVVGLFFAADLLSVTVYRILS